MNRITHLSNCKLLLLYAILFFQSLLILSNKLYFTSPHKHCNLGLHFLETNSLKMKLNLQNKILTIVQTILLSYVKKSSGIILVITAFLKSKIS